MIKVERFLKQHIIDACVKAANSKGLSDSVGVLRGTIFLSNEPVSMDQIVEETGYSKSTVSSNMALIERLGMARRIVIPGDKRYHYIPVNDPDSLKRAVLSNARTEINYIMAALDSTEKDLKGAENVNSSVLLRIGQIKDLYRQTEKLLDLVSLYTTDELINLLEKKRD